MMMTDETRSSREPVSVPPAVERQIDENLRLLYQQQLQDDLPDSLKALVEKLRGKDQKR
jgi:hypothetical protein